MNSTLADELRKRLIADYEFKEETGWLRKGICPQCAKRELYTHADSPWVIRCGRLDKCGYEDTVKSLYPDAFADFNRRYKPTQEDPNATAKAYLRYARGIDPAQIAGWFEQGKFWHPEAVGKQGTATVRFYLDAARSIYMERFVEEVTVIEDGEKKVRKAHFKGSHQGRWWAPPGLVIEDGDEVWLVEGILDAICLNLVGIKAVAILSCVNYPAKSLEEHKGKRMTWRWALDNDKAGCSWTRKHVRRMREDGLEAAAAQIPQQGRGKTDWNDLYQRQKLTDKDLKEYRYHGALLIAETAMAKALLMYKHTERKEFPFEHGKRLYWFNLNLDRYQKAYEVARERLGKDDDEVNDEELRDVALKESGTIAEIANCAFRFLYFQANSITDESWYYCRITFPHSSGSVKNTFTGGQVSSASEFKKRLLSCAAGAVFTGSGQQLDRIIKDQLFDIKAVETVDFIGYSKEHGVYVFPDIAVKDGRIYELNDEDFFDCGKLAIKSLSQSSPLQIQRDREKYTTEWVEQLYRCFGPRGMVALAFWFGSLFAEQIRELHKSFPFLEVVGEPGAGKSTLIEFLWKLVGRRDYEGFDPSKSTLAARARNFSQVSNLPIVLIEGDRDEDTARSKRFDWDELKTAYNGRSVRARGLKNSGNDTYEPPFRGSIVISQNAEVTASEAVLQRIVHLHFTRGDHTPETKAIAEQLERMPVEQVSHFLLTAVAREREVLEAVARLTPQHEQTLMASPDIKSVRIAKNHAQLMALVDALAKVIPLTDAIVNAAHDVLFDIAVERQQAINADPPIVQEFWEAFDFLNEKEGLNHSKNEELIAVNMNHFVEVATKRNQQVPDLPELKRALKASKTRKFIDIKPVNSALTSGNISGPKTVKCWVFEAGAGR